MSGSLADLIEETGSASRDDLRDMALVGHSLMATIDVVTKDGLYKDWSPAEDPAEIVTDLINDLEEALAALPSAGAGEAVSVKPLEWKAHDYDPETFFANSLLGSWSAWIINGKGYYRSLDSRSGQFVEGGLEGAKAAAQADYEQRIRSALVPAPSEPSEREKLRNVVSGIFDGYRRKYGLPFGIETDVLSAIALSAAPSQPAVVEGAGAGEASYQAYREEGAKEFADEPADLEGTLRMLDEWAPDALPANEYGQVPFARSLMDAAADSIRKHLATPDAQASRVEALEKAVDRAAIAWCGQKDRETFSEDVIYFKHNWRALPGLRAYVEREVGRAALAQQGDAQESGQ